MLQSSCKKLRVEMWKFLIDLKSYFDALNFSLNSMNNSLPPRDIVGFLDYSQSVSSSVLKVLSDYLDPFLLNCFSFLDDMSYKGVHDLADELYRITSTKK